ncbi:hypothetical protein ADK67_19190 [Saccharothrix sp. NRRL B-16348]|nr:hypothetical protein ADK67_19190 [Saccharothrix sp. NRRL B-16348]
MARLVGLARLPGLFRRAGLTNLADRAGRRPLRDYWQLVGRARSGRLIDPDGFASLTHPAALTPLARHLADLADTGLADTDLAGLAGG